MKCFSVPVCELQGDFLHERFSHYGLYLLGVEHLPSALHGAGKALFNDNKTFRILQLRSELNTVEYTERQRAHHFIKGNTVFFVDSYTLPAGAKTR